MLPAIPPILPSIVFFGLTLGINLCLPNKDFSPTKTISHNKEKVAEYGKYNLNGKSIDFIDLYHFAAVKSDKYCFYNPVMKILF